MGTAFYTEGTKEIRRQLHSVFGRSGIYATSAYAAQFNPVLDEKISDILYAIDLPKRNTPHFTPRLQERFRALFDAMLASESANPPTTTAHGDIRDAVFDILTRVANGPRPPKTAIKFYVAHQTNSPPYSLDNPDYKFVRWVEDDDQDFVWENFLLICPELPGTKARRIKKLIEKKRATAAKKPKSKKAAASKRGRGK